MQKLKTVSVVIPVFNEEKNIPILIPECREVLEKTGYSFELIIVDDGSTDNTFSILKKHELKQEINIIRLKKNYGKTTALYAGFSFAKGGIIVTLDGDLQNDPNDIPRLLKKLDGYDLVYGIRAKRMDPLFKVLYSKWANFLNNMINGEGIIDSNSPLRAFKKECLKNIKLIDGMHRFFPNLFMMEGFSVIGLEVSHRPRIYGKSRYSFKNRGLSPYIDMLVVWWTKKKHLDYEISYPKSKK
jgi:glycosyltransferase involved in cell wall biosynthesis